MRDEAITDEMDNAELEAVTGGAGKVAVREFTGKPATVVGRLVASVIPKTTADATATPRTCGRGGCA